MIPSHNVFPHNSESHFPTLSSQPTDNTKYMLPSPNVKCAYSPLPPVNSHHMVTRSKAGIHKPIIPFTGVANTGVVDDSTDTPSSVSVALNHPLWYKAMHE